jgi:hypothetical protein
LQAFAEMAMMLFDQLSELWQSMSTHLLTSLSAASYQSTRSHLVDTRAGMEQTTTMIKILKRLLIYGFVQLQKAERLAPFFDVYVKHMQQLMAFLRAHISGILQSYKVANFCVEYACSIVQPKHACCCNLFLPYALVAL